MTAQNKEAEKKANGVSCVNSRLKKVIVSVIGVILVVNIFWTLKGEDASSDVSSPKEELVKLEQRVAELEKGIVPDVEALRAEFDQIRKMGEGYEARLAALLKAEEEGLAAMKKVLEEREAWLESLKKAIAEGK